MEIHETIRKLRGDKHFSQEAIAHVLELTQSQYCRREKGKIHFSAEEVSLLAKVLETTVAQIYGEEANSFTVHTQNGGNFGQYISIPEKLIELYEAKSVEKENRIKSLTEEVSFLRQMLLNQQAEG